MNMGRAMIEVASTGYPRPILLPRDINQLADAYRGARSDDEAERRSLRLSSWL
jgi:hypothetical protein